MAHLITHDGYTIHEEFVTPDDAKLMLDLHDIAEADLGHKGNRNLRPEKVVQYCRDMEHGNWGWCPDLVTLTPKGLIIQGRHRLNALAKANTPGIWMLIADGVPRDEMFNFDSTIKRTGSDQLTLKLQAPNAAGAVAVLQSLREYDPVEGVDRRVVYSQAEMLADYERYASKVQECIRQLRPVQPFGLMTKTGYPVWWEMFDISPDGADEFFRMLGASESSGLRGAREQPLTVLRDRLWQQRNEAKVARQLPAREVRALVIKTWNAWRDGKPLTVAALRFREYGPGAEKFPRLH